MKRYVYLGAALGMMVALAGAVMVACYRVPTPVCGFRCGPSGECPTDYACASFEDRCHLNGSDPNIHCDTIDDTPEDAPIDEPIDAVIFDTPGDASGDALDGGTDAPTD